MAFTCGAIVGGDDNDALLELLTIAIVAPVAPPVDCEIAVLLLVVAICCCCCMLIAVSLLVVAICCCCCFGRAATLPAVVVGFVVVVCCGGGDDDDDTADVDGGVAADNEGGFTVFGIPQIVDSVVLTTLRLGLLGSHIFALISDEIVLLSELLSPAAGDDDDNCCA
jgi:hypothetical protein